MVKCSFHGCYIGICGCDFPNRRIGEPWEKSISPSAETPIASEVATVPGQMALPDLADLREHPLRCPFPSCVSRFAELDKGTSMRCEEQGGGWIAECRDCCSGTGSFESRERAIDEWNAVALLCQRPAFDLRMHFTYEDLWKAYETGSIDAHANWKAGLKDFKRAADGYCKLIHAERDPQMFESLGNPHLSEHGGEQGAPLIFPNPAPSPVTEELLKDRERLDKLEAMCFTNREGEREIHFDFKGPLRSAIDTARKAGQTNSSTSSA